MNIKLKANENIGELYIEGRLDSNSYLEAENIFMKMTERFNILILDFARLEYVSSAGLRTLKKINVAMKQKGGELTIRHVNKMVMEVFEMTGFIGILKVEK